jgi:RNA polymerase sigma-70 factor (ECF subfamily)
MAVLVATHSVGETGAYQGHGGGQGNLHETGDVMREPANNGAADVDAGRLAELIRRCADRDPQACGELYRLVAPRLLACLVRMLHRRDAAEDALQDVFVQVWNRAGQFDATRGHPLAWLVSMARYRAIDLLRAQRAPLAAVSGADGAEDALVAEGLTLDAQADLAQSASLLERCLAQLSAVQRRCLQLAFWEGYSHAQVALSTGNPVGTVKSWIRRGLLSLRQCLQP